MPKSVKLCDLMEELAAEMVDKGIFWHEAVAQFEKHFIQNALRKSEGNIVKTSAIMGVHRNTLSKRMAQHKIARQRVRRSSP